MSKFTHLFLPILSGVLVAFSYIPFSPFLGLVALVPLWLSWDRAKNWKQIFWQSWLCQFILSLIGFHWIAITAHDFGYMPWSLSILVLLAFCCLIHLHFCLAGVLWFFLQKKLTLNHWGKDLLKVACFFLMETYWPMIFPWNFGYNWVTSSLPLKQTAEIWGFVGISFLCLTLNAGIKNLWQEWLTGRKKVALRFLAGALGIFLCLNLLGYSLLKSLPETDFHKNFLVVQANIGNFEKIQVQHGVNYQEEILLKYMDLTEEGLKKYPDTDYIVWPETAIPLIMSSSGQGDRLYFYLIQRLRTWKKWLISGSFLSDTDVYNGAISISPQGTITGEYKKNHLLAFGETVPFTEGYPKLQEWLRRQVPALSFFGRGKSNTPLAVENHKIGLNICYEGIHPNFIAKQSLQGAHFLINITNDSWFGTTFEPQQHMYMTLARSIENRIPVLRVTNTGVSSAMDHRGVQKQESPMKTDWVEQISLSSYDTPRGSIYQKYSNFWPLVLLFLLGALIFPSRNKQIEDTNNESEPA